ncbi:MAG: GNAT family N-acetyltransferase [Prevotella sp.]|jgi:ribosomal protein S18 acetylase RimI-like enzyme|nr:GNAT family N-acetyltransferase [Prevotella sp.]
MIIRKGTISDLDKLEDLYNDLNDYLNDNTNYPGWIKHVYPIRKTAEEGINEETLFVLEADNNIMGSIILNHKPEDAYHQAEWKVDTGYENIIVIHTLVTNPNFMKQGIGSRLMDFTRQYAISLNMKSIRLDVSINNTAAIALYEKHNYEYIGTVDLRLGYEHLKWFRLYEYVL